MNSRELLQWAMQEIGNEKRFEVEHLLCSVLHLNRALLLAHDLDVIAAPEKRMFQTKIHQLKQGMPLQYLVGTTNFMGLDFRVSPAVLIPRFDTERLVEMVLQILEPISAPCVLDLCTGSGAIAVAISHERQDAQVWATDISAEALAVAEENNRENRTTVQFCQGNLFEPFMGGEKVFDVIVSNPPYIPNDQDIEAMVTLFSAVGRSRWLTLLSKYCSASGYVFETRWLVMF